MPKKLLIVVDVINGFIKTGALADQKISKIIPYVSEEIERGLQRKDDIVAFRNSWFQRKNENFGRSSSSQKKTC